MSSAAGSDGELFMLLRELSERMHDLAYLVLHGEATTVDVNDLAEVCSAMSGALNRYAATLGGGGCVVESWVGEVVDEAL